MKPASKYFQTLFPTVEDASAFLFANPGTSYKRNDIVHHAVTLVSGGLERLEYMVNDKLHSYAVAPGDSRLLPAVVQHYFYNSRARLASNPHYFWCHWFKEGEEFASMKVEPNADGIFPVVGYCSTDKKLVVGTAAEVWAALPGYYKAPTL